MTILTDKEQALARTVVLAGVATPGAGLAGVMGVHFDGHAALQSRFIGDHGMQLSKRPLGMTGVGFALLLGGLFAMFAFRAFPNICQVLKPNEAVWVLLNNVFTHHVIGVLLQPSLSSRYRDQTARGGMSAFLLQTLSQTSVVIRLGNNAFSRREGTVSFRGTTDGQIANTHIHTGNARMRLGCGIGNFNLKGNEQVKLLAGFVVPQFRSPDGCSLLNEGHMLVIAAIGHNHAPIKREDAHLLLLFEAVVMTQLVGQGGETYLGA